MKKKVELNSPGRLPPALLGRNRGITEKIKRGRKGGSLHHVKKRSRLQNPLLTCGKRIHSQMSTMLQMAEIT